jgi:hypothetical protein
MRTANWWVGVSVGMAVGLAGRPQGVTVRTADAANTPVTTLSFTVSILC